MEVSHHLEIPARLQPWEGPRLTSYRMNGRDPQKWNTVEIVYKVTDDLCRYKLIVVLTKEYKYNVMVSSGNNYNSSQQMATIYLSYNNISKIHQTTKNYGLPSFGVFL